MQDNWSRRLPLRHIRVASMGATHDTNHQTADTNHQTADFIHNMFTHMFCPRISKPTRVTNYSATIIDNIITNIHEYPIKSGILFNDISYHFPIFNIYKLGWQNTKKYKSIFKRNTNLNNMHELNINLKNANWARVYNELNPNNSYEIFIKILILTLMNVYLGKTHSKNGNK